MSLVHTVFNQTTGAGTAANPDDSTDTQAGTVAPGIIYPQVLRDQQGYFQFQLSDPAATFTAEIMTRFDDNAPWSRILEIDQTDGAFIFGSSGWQTIGGTRQMITIAVPMGPQMRVLITAAPSAGNLTVWMVE